MSEGAILNTERNGGREESNTRTLQDPATINFKRNHSTGYKLKQRLWLTKISNSSGKVQETGGSDPRANRDPKRSCERSKNKLESLKGRSPEHTDYSEGQSHPSIVRLSLSSVELSASIPSTHPAIIVRLSSSSVELSASIPSSHPSIVRLSSSSVNLSASVPSSHPSIVRLSYSSVELSASIPSSHPSMVRS